MKARFFIHMRTDDTYMGTDDISLAELLGVHGDDSSARASGVRRVSRACLTQRWAEDSCDESRHLRAAGRVWREWTLASVCLLPPTPLLWASPHSQTH